MKSCIDCQVCCHYLTIPVGKFDKDYIEFYKNFGLDMLEDDRVYLFVVPCSCQYITKEGCSIYENRPKVCRQQQPDMTDVICSYKEKWDGKF